MKAVVVHAPDRVEVVERSAPVPGPGDLLVAMRAVGLCGSDTTAWYVATKAPAVLGHETAGVVVEAGPGVTAFRPGDRVFVHHHAPCGSCRACARGDSVMCPAWKPNRLDPGGLAELVRVDAAAVAADTLKLPDGLGFDDGALVEPLACAVKAVARARVLPGDSVLVVGTGSNGVLLGLLARRAGAARLLGSDPDPARRRLALGFGFDEVFDPAEPGLPARVRGATGGGGADAVLVVPTAEQAVQAAVASAAPGGRVVFYSPVSPDAVWRLAPSEPYFRDLTLAFSYSSGPAETRAALALIEEGVVSARRLVTHRLPIERAAEAFRLARAGGEVLKVLVEIGP